MTRVLITGMSGTGKSTAHAELARRGHRVVDADLSAWSIASPDGSGAEQLWREDAIDTLPTRERVHPGAIVASPLAVARLACYRPKTETPKLKIIRCLKKLLTA
jgi:predicted ATPase